MMVVRENVSTITYKYEFNTACVWNLSISLYIDIDIDEIEWSWINQFNSQLPKLSEINYNVPNHPVFSETSCICWVLQEGLDQFNDGTCQHWAL